MTHGRRQRAAVRLPSAGGAARALPRGGRSGVLQFSSGAAVRIPWATIVASLRISTNPRVFERPLTTAEAERAVSSWLALPSVSPVDPGERYWDVLRDMLHRAQVTGPLVTDAALAIEHGATLCTTDRDFARFPGLRTFNPLDG